MRRFLQILFLVMTIYYGWLFLESLQGRWFDPQWTTDDAVQQAFIFHEITNPGLFSGNYIAEMMRHYVVPLHLWLGRGITYFTQDPLMTGHWIMLVQLVAAIGFLLLSINKVAGMIPALFGVTWFLHTRNTIQRLSGGLQRGWAPGLFFAYFYFLFKENHKGVWITIFIGCLLHPPTALTVIISYWLLLALRFINPQTRAKTKSVIFIFLILNPIFAATTFWAVKKPEKFGQIVTYQQAASMPSLSQNGGRFKAYPHWSAWDEISGFAFQAFDSSLHDAGKFFEQKIPFLVMLLFGLLLLVGLVKKKNIIPAEILTFLAAIFITYFASRYFAFKLFLPQRYVQIPMTVFFVVSFPVAIWRLFSCTNTLNKNIPKKEIMGTVALIVLGTFVYLGSGSGLQGDCNFNKARFGRERLWNWIELNTSQNALFAGHPSHIDPVPLFAKRNIFITTETAHPLYDKYFTEVKRRLELSFRAHYAKDLKELSDILIQENIDYFVFKRKLFYPEALKSATYFEPLGTLVKQLTSRHYTDYAYKQLPREVDPTNHPYMPYRDDESVVVEVAKLVHWLK